MIKMSDEEITEDYVSKYGFGSDCNNLTSYDANMAIKQAILYGLKVGRQSGQFIKAKKHIQNLLDLLPNEVLYHDYYRREYVDPAKQFIKEIEK